MLTAWYFWIGLSACVGILSGIFSSLLGFKGMKGEAYRIKNHFISELGDPRFAPKYRIFNLTLIIGGILLIPFIIGWGLTFNSIFGNICIILGVVVAILCTLIGIYPEHKEKEHFNIAGLFFIGMTLLILLVGINNFMQQNSSYSIGILVISIITCIISSIFIIHTFSLPKWEYLRTYRPWEWDPERPKIWWNPFLEWIAFVSMMVWLLIISLMGITQ